MLTIYIDADACPVKSEVYRVAGRYDLANHLLSLNIDRLWRTRTVRRVSHILERGDAQVLDICCGTGDLVLTNRHLSFLSNAIALKIALRHIVALVPHADGLRVMRDEASGRPQTFVVDDPAFAAAAITLLNRL